MTSTYQSWGRFPPAQQQIMPLYWRHQPLPNLPKTTTLLPYGLGRSYGDVCLNDGGMLLATRGLNRFINFDPKTGVLCCEAGTSFIEIAELTVPQGWFFPVTPGTQYLTVGGAMGNDVHGKNHHRAGTFGRHVLEFELLRSNGERLICSPTQNAEYYRATIGGLGLTGLITWVKFQMLPIVHRAVEAEIIQFDNLEAFFDITAESDQKYDYTMAWVDCSARGKNLGRGIFFQGNFVTAENKPAHWRVSKRKHRVPIDFPSFALNRWSVQAFNILYYNKPFLWRKEARFTTLMDYQAFFYPLDAVLEWNRIYGKPGFLQYQFVVPDQDHTVIREILATIAATGLNSFLAVLKHFGDVPSPGMMSFPRSGITLALDFPIKGASTFNLLERLDDMVLAANGAVYPCKDARLPARHFQRYYPQWCDFAHYVDPHFSSSFWRRVTEA